MKLRIPGADLFFTCRIDFTLDADHEVTIVLYSNYNITFKSSDLNLCLGREEVSKAHNTNFLRKLLVKGH